MKVRNVVFASIVGGLAAGSLAAQTPVLGSLEAPYPGVQSTVRIAGGTYGPGAVAYGPVGTPLVLTGSNLGSGGIVQFIGYKNGAVDPGTTVQATVTMWSPTVLFLTVPSGAVSGLVTVNVAGRSSANGLPFVVTPGAYSASCAPFPPNSQLQITTASLPNGTAGQFYSATLNASGGTKPYTWSLVNGSLPSGLSLNASMAAISGTPTSATVPTDLTFEVTDSSLPARSDQAVLSLTIGSQTFVPGTVYSYSITNGANGSGYEANGNIQNYTDQVTGTWTVNYDTLNRIALAQGTLTGNALPDYCWSYDVFGNRTDEEQGTSAFTGGGAAACSPQNHQVFTYNANNQVSGGPVVMSYDGAGDVNTDSNQQGVHQYLYDAEGRVCAVESPGVNGGSIMTGYVYDAEGRRVAKGAITTMSCDPTTAGFSPTVNETDYILDQAGHQVTEMASGMNGTMNWAHTNVWAGGELLGTYSPVTDDGGQPDGALSFYLNDWLGTRRAQTDYAGNLEQNCASLPFGDGETCNPTTTEHLFTGKERDAESGNDYFGARYYASTMGRFLSPDWASDPTAVPYASYTNPQSLNLYGYMRNNPLGGTDPDGHCCWEFDLANWIGTGIATQGAGGFARNVGVGIAKGAGQFAYNTAAMAAAGSGPGGAGAAAQMMMNQPASITPSNLTQAQVAFVTNITIGVVATAPIALETVPAEAAEEIPEVAAESFGIKGAPAPDQVTPGIENVKGVYDGEHGAQPYSAHYDEYGRQVGRTDYTSAPDATNHPDPHYHTREYGPGYGPKGKESGPVPGEHPKDQQ
jgi:RHS repeat-associated protein